MQEAFIKLLNLAPDEARRMRGRGVVSIRTTTTKTNDPVGEGTSDKKARLKRMAGQQSQQANRLIHMAKRMKSSRRMDEELGKRRNHELNQKTIQEYLKAGVAIIKTMPTETEEERSNMAAQIECTEAVAKLDLCDVIHSATMENNRKNALH